MVLLLITKAFGAFCQCMQMSNAVDDLVLGLRVSSSYWPHCEYGAIWWVAAAEHVGHLGDLLRDTAVKHVPETNVAETQLNHQ